MRARTDRWVAIAALLLCATAERVSAQDYVREATPNAFRDLTTAETALELPLAGKDEDGIGLELGFSFPFFGQSFTTVTVATNGYLTFGTAINPLNEPIPSNFPPDGLIAPFWDDLDLRASGKVLFQREQTQTGQAALVIQWEDVAFAGDLASRLSFQVVLIETGEIQFHYGELKNGDGSSGGRASGSSATVGLEAPNGAYGAPVSFDTPGVLSSFGRGIAFLPSGPALPEGRLLGDLDGDGRVTILDQSRLVELAHPDYRVPSALELVASDVAPLATNQLVSVWGNGRIDISDRDLVSDRILRRVALPPYLGALSPARPSPGQTLTLTGSDFAPTAADNRVVFPRAGGGTVTVSAATVNAPSNSRLTVSVPADARSGPVYVVRQGQRSNARALIPAGIPSITAVAPLPAVVGEEITIVGEEFPATAAETIVRIGSATATVVSLVQGTDGNPDQLVARISSDLLAGVHPLRVATASVESEPVDLTLGDLPIARIDAPLTGAEVRDRITVYGAATDPSDFARYELAIAPLEGGDFSVIHSATAAVTSGALGVLDPTTLINGYYRLRLTVTDAQGLSASDETSFSVQGKLKLGVYTLVYTDLEIPAPGIDLEIRREYDSRDKVSRDFGFGWRLRWVSLAIEEATDHSLTLQTPDGSRGAFAFAPVQINSLDPRFWTAAFEAEEGDERAELDFETPEGVLEGNHVLARDSVGNYFWFPSMIPFDPAVYRLTLLDGTVFRVHDEDELLQILTPAGPTITVSPNGLIHSEGRSVIFERDSSGRIARITDPRGNEVRYEYDEVGDLVRHTNPEGETSSFSYHPNHYLNQRSSDLGLVFSSEYDQAGRLVATTDAYGKTTRFEHDLGDRRQITRDRLGRPTVMEYDESGRMTRILDSDGRSQQMAYDERGNLVLRVDRLGQTWRYEYDASGNQVAATGSDGLVRRYEWDARGNMTRFTDPDGGESVFVYNAQNRLTLEVDPAGGQIERRYDASGNLVWEKNKAGQVTTHSYELGDHVRQVEPGGLVTLFEYDANGNLTKKTRLVPSEGISTQSTTTYRYDRNNRRTQVIRPDGTSSVREYAFGGRLSKHTTSDGEVTNFVYDALGNLLQAINQDGGVEVRNYDDLGRLVSIQRPDGSTKTQLLNDFGKPSKIVFANGSEAQMEYDALGRLSARVDGRGQRWEREYDAAGNVVLKRDPSGAETSFTYDGKGNVLTETDPDGHVTHYAYDAVGRIISMTLPNGRQEVYERDVAGRITRKTDLNGRVTAYTYGNAYDDVSEKTFGADSDTAYERDREGRVVARTDRNGNVTAFAYDPDTGLRTEVTLPMGEKRRLEWTDGNLTRLVDYNGQQVTQEYDSRGNVTFRILPSGVGQRLTYDAEGERVTAIEEVRGETTFEYDLLGRLTRRTEPDGQYLAYVYDDNNNLTSIAAPIGTVTYTYDLANRLTSVTSFSGEETTYEYSRGGKLQRVIRPTGVETSYDLDEAGVLLGVQHRKDGAVIAGYAYAYDEWGNRVRVTEASGRVVEYDYDEFSRLTREVTREATAEVTTTNYTYDKVGNRLERLLERPDGTLERVIYSYDRNYRLLREDVEDTGPLGTYEVTYSYDSNGNTLSRLSPNREVRYGYDGLGRLTSAVVTQGLQVNEVNYTYDYYGNRIQTIRDGVVTNHLIDTRSPVTRVIADLDSSGAVLATYDYGYSPLSKTTSQGTMHFLLDGQFSVRHALDGNGGVTGSYDYDAYGVTLRSQGASCHVQYASEWRDPTTGLYDLRARTMDPRLGRFLTRDKFEGFSYDPGSLHPYNYANGNPVTLADPLGTFSISIPFLVGIALPAAIAGIGGEIAQSAGIIRSKKLTRLLSKLNLFLPKVLDVFNSSADRLLAESLFGQALATDPATFDGNFDLDIVNKSTSLTYLLGSKSYGHQGPGVALALNQTSQGSLEPPLSTRALQADLFFAAGEHRTGVSNEFARQLEVEAVAQSNRIRQSPAVAKIRTFLEERANVEAIEVGEFQKNAGGDQVGYNLVSIAFTVPDTLVRWNIMVKSRTRPEVSDLDRILRNDPFAIVCEVNEDISSAEFADLLRRDCSNGRPSPFILTVKSKGGGFVVQKEALNVRTLKAPIRTSEGYAAIGVVPASGEFVLRRMDVKVVARGDLNWELARTYRSGVVFPNEPPPGIKSTFRMGHNWTLNYDRRLGPSGSGVLIDYSALGRSSDQHKLPLGRAGTSEASLFTYPSGIFKGVIRIAVSYERFTEAGPEQVVELGYRRRSPNGVMEAYNAAGWLIELSDKFGNRMLIRRDEEERIREVIDPIERVYSYHYEEFGGGSQGSQWLLTRVRDETGFRDYTFEYDEELNLVAAKTPLGRTERYEYSSSSNPVLAHNLTAVYSPNESEFGGEPVLRNTYFEDPSDFSYDMVRTQTYGGNTVVNSVAGSRSVSAGGTFQFSYAETSAVRVGGLDAIATETTVIDRGGNRLHYAFNRNGNLREFTDQANNRTTHFYNAQGLRVLTEWPSGRREVFGYDPGRLNRAQAGNLLVHMMFPASGSDPAIVREYAYEPYFNVRVRKTESEGFLPVYSLPEDLNGDPYEWLTPSARYENYTDTFVVDYQEASAPLVPGQLESLFGMGLDKVGEYHATLPERWRLPLGFGDLNEDGVQGPDLQLDYRSPGFSGVVVASIRRPVIDPAAGGPAQVSQQLYQHNEFGQLTLHVDAEGNTTTLEYHRGSVIGAGRLRRIVKDATQGTRIPRTSEVAPAEATQSFEYDIYGNITRTIDQVGTTQTQVWSADGLLTESYRASNISNLNYKTTYSYDRNTNLVRVLHEDKGGPNPRGGLERRIAYDILDNMVEESQRLESATESTWLTTRYTYDERELLTRVDHPEPGVVTQYTYDPRRLRLSVTQGAFSNDAATTRYAYDAVRNVVSVELPDGDKTLVAYDAFDRPLRRTDPNGTVTETTYDVSGKVVGERVFGTAGGETPSGNDTSQNVLLAETVVRLDSMYRKVASVRTVSFDQPPSVSESRFSYDRLDRVVQTTDPGGQVTTVKYDGLSRPAEVRDPLGNKVSTTYDDKGQVLRTAVSEIQGDGTKLIVTQHTYDALSRRISTTDSAGQTTAFAYNSRDSIIRATDGLGNVVFTQYDSAGRVTATTAELREGGAGGGALVGTVEVAQEWDRNSRLSKTTDPNGNVTRFSYDALNRLVSRTYADGSSATYTYNVDSTVSRATDPNGTVVSYQYDSVNRLVNTSVAYTDSATTAGTTSASYQYDGLGRLTLSGDNNGFSEPSSAAVTSYSYDALSRVVTEGQSLSPGTAVQSVWSVDPSRKLKCKYGAERDLDMTYDSLDRPTQTAEASGSAIWDASYAGGAGRLLARNIANGAACHFEHDGINRTLEIKHLNSNSDPFATRRYAYNQANIRVSEERVEAASTRSFGYDSLYRLLQVDYGSPFKGRTSRSYTLDSAGNRVVHHDVSGVASVTSYQTNALNQYTSVGVESLRYDRNGNLVEDGERTYQYDYQNRLVLVRRSADQVTIARYRYDTLGRRVQRDVYVATHGAPAGTTRYVYDGMRVVQERDGLGRTTATYVYGTTGPDDCVQLERTVHHPAGAGKVYYHHNARGDVVALTNEAGGVFETVVYDDYGDFEVRDASGTPLQGAGASGNPYLFQGRRFDPETGLYYFRARYYSPSLGRFLQRDPAQDAANLGNLYTFAANNPFTFTDPSGAIVETGFDLLSLTIGISSFTYNVMSGNWGAAAVDALGIVADSIALVVPGVPGGVGAGLKVWRGGKTVALGCKARTAATGVQALNNAVTAVQGAMGAYESYQEGSTGWAMAQGALSGLAGMGAISQTLRAAKGFCFLSGTLVETSEGKVRIEDVRVGDRVLSRNEHTGEQGYKLVTRLFRGHTDRVVYLRIAKASSVQRGRSERRSSGSRKGGSSSDGKEGSGSGGDPDSQIRCTPEHPFWVRGRGWVAARELREGDPLVGSQGEQLVVVDREVREEEADHYNFEVEDWHTYFVSKTDQDWAVWTHNRCDPPEAPQNIGNMVGVDFVDPIFGNLSRKEFSALRKRVKAEYGVTFRFNSRQAQREGNHMAPRLGGSPVIHLESRTRNPNRRMIFEEIQHAIDELTDADTFHRAFQPTSIPANNRRLHAGTYSRMADNPLFDLSQQERESLRTLAQRWME